MDLSCSVNRRTRIHGEHDESANCNLRSASSNPSISAPVITQTTPTTTTTTPKDASPGQSLSVREMIKRYNTVAATTYGGVTVFSNPVSGAGACTVAGAEGSKQRMTLPASKSAYFSGNKFGSQSNVKEFVSQVKDGDTTQAGNDGASIAGSMGTRVGIYGSFASGGEVCGSLNSKMRRGSAQSLGNENSCKRVFISNHTTRTSRSPNRDESDLKHTPSKENNSLSRSNSNENTSVPSLENSYQSKTTIAKTPSGVRITIDIFFDQDQPVSTTDIIGSRVETDIPQSRILSEFQHKALAEENYATDSDYGGQFEF